MAAHIAWNGHRIGGLEKGAIVSYKDFSISFSTKTKAKDGNGVLYVGRQGYNAAECQVTLDLRTSLGQDVPESGEAFKRDNRNGECAHLFIGGKDFGSDFLLTDVGVIDAKFQPVTGAMISAEVKLTWKESDGAVYDNTSSTPSGSGKDSAKKSKGTGSKYLKSRKDVGASAGGTAGGSTGKSGNLTGAVGGYNTSGISSSAKKINPPCQSTIRDSKKRPGKNTVSSK